MTANLRVIRTNITTRSCSLLLLLVTALLVSACSEKSDKSGQVNSEPTVKNPPIIFSDFLAPKRSVYWIDAKSVDGALWTNGYYNVCRETAKQTPILANGTKVYGAILSDDICDGWLWINLAEYPQVGFWIKSRYLTDIAPAVSVAIDVPNSSLNSSEPTVPVAYGPMVAGNSHVLDLNTQKFVDNYYKIDVLWPENVSYVFVTNFKWTLDHSTRCTVFVNNKWVKGFYRDPTDYSQTPTGTYPIRQEPDSDEVPEASDWLGHVMRPPVSNLLTPIDELIQPYFSGANDMLFVITIDGEVDSIETRNCGVWNKLDSVEYEPIQEKFVYLVNDLPIGIYDEDLSDDGYGKDVPYMGQPRPIEGLMPYGTYQNSGTTDLYTMCMVYKVSNALGVSNWLPLGYNEYYQLKIDQTWSLFASAGCGTWRLQDKDDVGKPLPVSTENTEPDLADTIWDYCARTGSTDLRGDLPPHIEEQLNKLLRYPGRYWVDDYVGRCGYAAGSSTATFLVCNPWSMARTGLGDLEDRWQTWANYPIQNYCWNKYRVGDTSTSPLTGEWVHLACSNFNNGCNTERMSRRDDGGYWLFWKSHGVHENSIYSSYIEDGYIYPNLGPRAIDRDGYFSDRWTVIPQGCTPFEFEEIRQTRKLGILGHLFYALNQRKSAPQVGELVRRHCLGDALRVEVSYEIPDGEPLKLIDLESAWYGYTKEHIVLDHDPYKSWPGEDWRERESIQLIAYRHGVTYRVLEGLNGGWELGVHGWPKAGEKVLVPDRDRTIYDDENWEPYWSFSETDAVIPKADGEGTGKSKNGLIVLVYQECRFDSAHMGWGYEVGDDVDIIGRGTGPCAGWSVISIEGYTGWLADEKFERIY